MTVKNAMNLFRDVQVAEEFHQMAAEGYIDTEFTMYATTWLDGGERHYLVSADEARVIDFLDGAVRAGIAPLPIRSLTETCPVPLGEKENIAHNVKLELARSLQQDYPLEFFQLLARFAAQDGDDAAVPLLKKWCKKTVNRFSEELLTVVEALADMAWRRKSLTRESYRIFCDWAEKERENFAEDIIPKDVCAKTWYTLCSFDASGRIKRVTNARKEWTYHKRLSLEKEGKIVAPVFAKTYWYNNQTDADSIRAQHVAHVQTLLDDDYMAAVQEIAGYPSVIDAQDFAAALDRCARLRRCCRRSATLLRLHLARSAERAIDRKKI